jgi:hypothetical protein
MLSPAGDAPASAAPDPRLVRYAGLAGALLLAFAAHLGGVRRPWIPNADVLGLIRGEQGILLPVSWLAGTILLIGAWWVGRRTVPSTRWAYVTAGLWMLPMLVPAVLASRDVYSYACQGHVMAAGEDPYSAGLTELGCPWIDATAPIWRDSPAPYGPLFVVLAGLAARLGGTLTGTLVLLKVIAVAGVLLTAVALPALARRAGREPKRAVWLVLACPLVAVHLVSGAHNDALMVGLLVAGLAVVTVRRPGWLVLGGALLGLAVAVKATALVVVPFAALVAVGSPYRSKVLIVRGGTVVVAAVGALAAVSFASGLGAGWVRGLTRSGDSVQWTSPPTAVGMTVDYLGRPFGLELHAVPVTRVIGVVVLAVVLVLLWWHSRGGNALRAAGLALAATVALAPVFHPWYATWPLAVLAAVHRETRWLLVPVAVACALVLPDGTNLALATRLPGALVVTGLVVFVIVRVVRSRRAVRVPQIPVP